MIFKDEKEFVGHLLLEPEERGDTKEAELSYVLLPEFWGKGIATASVRELFQQIVIPILFPKYLFKEQQVLKVFARIRPDNMPSQRVLEKNSFTAEFNGDLKETSFGPHRFYVRSLI